MFENVNQALTHVILGRNIAIVLVCAQISINSFLCEVGTGKSGRFGIPREKGKTVL